MDFALNPELIEELKNLGFGEDYIMTLTDIAAAGGDIDELVKELVASKEEEDDEDDYFGSSPRISPRLGCVDSKMFQMGDDELAEFAALLEDAPDDEEDISGMLGEDEEEEDYLKESARGSITGEYGIAYSCTCEDGIHVYF